MMTKEQMRAAVSAEVLSQYDAADTAIEFLKQADDAILGDFGTDGSVAHYIELMTTYLKAVGVDTAVEVHTDHTGSLVVSAVIGVHHVRNHVSPEVQALMRALQRDAAIKAAEDAKAKEPVA